MHKYGCWKRRLIGLALSVCMAIAILPLIGGTIIGSGDVYAEEDNTGTEMDEFAVSEEEYLQRYKDNDDFEVVGTEIHYQYLSREKEYTTSGQDSLSGWSKYNTKTTSSTSGYQFGTPVSTQVTYPKKNGENTKTVASAVNKGYYYYAYAVANPSKTSDWTYYVAKTKSAVVSHMKKNFSNSNTWSEKRLRYFWYISSSDLGATSSKLNKTIPYCASSNTSVGTTTQTGTHKYDLQIFRYKQCYKIKTDVTVNYFYRWKPWTVAVNWSTERQTIPNDGSMSEKAALWYKLKAVRKQNTEPTYTVTYNANGGSGAPAAQKKAENVNLTLSATEPTRSGYTFQGWSTSSSGSVQYSAGEIYSENSSITLYAVWKENEAQTDTVSCNANGDSGVFATQRNSTKSISNCRISINTDHFIYDGRTKSVAITVTDMTNAALKNGVDYKVSGNSRVNAGEQIVTVTGIGKYSGSKKIAFSIWKADPNLYFHKSSITIKKGESFSNTLTYPKNVVKTYRSSNTNVAQVSQDGKVKVVGTGTTTVTVSVPSTTNYNAKSASYTLTVKPAQSMPYYKKVLKFKKVALPFPNPWGKKEKASLKVCKIVYKASDAKKYCNNPKYNTGNKGNCFGMATTAGLLYKSGIKKQKKKKEKSKYRWGKKGKPIKVKTQVKAMQAAVPSDQNDSMRYIRTTAELASAVKNDLNKNQITVVSMYKGSNGHAVAVIGFETINASYDRLTIYDSSSYKGAPDAYKKPQYLYLYKTNGAYNGNWKYTVNGKAHYNHSKKGDGQSLRYTTYSQYSKLWAKRGTLTFHP